MVEGKSGFSYNKPIKYMLGIPSPIRTDKSEFKGVIIHGPINIEAYGNNEKDIQ